MSNHKVVKLTDLISDPRLQMRECADEATINDYAEAMREGQEFPPLEVVKVEEKHFIVDGYQRAEAAKRADLKSIACNVVEGTFEDALWAAVGANKRHGLRPNRREKRKQVLEALAHPRSKELTTREIALHCGVSHTFVANIRREQLVDVDRNPTADNPFGLPELKASFAYFRPGHDESEVAVLQPHPESDKFLIVHVIARGHHYFTSRGCGYDVGRISFFLEEFGFQPDLNCPWIEVPKEELPFDFELNAKERRGMEQAKNAWLNEHGDLPSIDDDEFWDALGAEQPPTAAA